MPEAAVISGRMTDAPTQGQGCVLIIDDEAEIRESLQTLLEFEGYEVESAANAAQGI
jgi:DNA-binding NtrC family response regulator